MHTARAPARRPPPQVAPLLHGINMGTPADPLPTLQPDLAVFLAMRGPFAWTGAGVWGMSWPTGQARAAGRCPLVLT